MKYFTALISGLIFGVGLGISGMMNPDKVKNFLDVSGHWDPSLMFVMGGALVVGFIAFRFSLKRKSPVCESKFDVPKNNSINFKLIAGSALFGLGWGLGGICPGPAFANLATGTTSIIIFIGSMVVGMAIVEISRKIRPNSY